MPPQSITDFLDTDQQKDLLRFLTAGSVDDGKSTLIGRLLFDSKKIYEDQLDALERDSKRVGHAGDNIDYALLLDGLKAEREQGITIDVAYRYFSTSKRKFIIADTPGHEQYTRNMITGGSTANLAILLADARKGVITQTKRHTFLVSLLGIKHVVLAVNKMDLVDYDKKAFDRICQDYYAFTAQLDLSDITFIPVSALLGDNVVDISGNMPWYRGESLLGFLENIHIANDRNFQDLRFPVQYIIRPSSGYRAYAGKMASGLLMVGDEVMALPSGKRSRVRSILGADGPVEQAFPPQSVSFTLEDEIDLSRGEMLVHPNNTPRIERHFEAMLVWMDEQPMDPYTQFLIKHNTRTTRVRIDEFRYKVDVNTLQRTEVTGLKLNEIGRAVFTTQKPLLFDPYQRNKETGAFVLIDPVTNNTVAVGMIIDKVSNKFLPSRITSQEQEQIIRSGSLISRADREQHYGQQGVTIWLTGLHGCGKNELAFALEKELFKNGKVVVVFDGISVRSGLSSELDFSPADRAEHLRRVAHMCRLLNEQGIITICSFISPTAAVREQVRSIINTGNRRGRDEHDRFRLIHVDAPLGICKQRDKYGLYAKAAKNEIEYLAGVDLAYEVPVNPDLVVKVTGEALSIEPILAYMEKEGIVT